MLHTIGSRKVSIYCKSFRRNLPVSENHLLPQKRGEGWSSRGNRKIHSSVYFTSLAAVRMIITSGILLPKLCRMKICRNWHDPPLSLSFRRSRRLFCGGASRRHIYVARNARSIYVTGECALITVLRPCGRSSVVGGDGLSNAREKNFLPRRESNRGPLHEGRDRLTSKQRFNGKTVTADICIVQ